MITFLLVEFACTLADYSTIDMLFWFGANDLMAWLKEGSLTSEYSRTPDDYSIIDALTVLFFALLRRRALRAWRRDGAGITTEPTSADDASNQHLRSWEFKRRG